MRIRGNNVKQRISYARHHDTEFFDEIVIRTVPRWKESELSGDEWRVSALAEFKFKGEVLHTHTFQNVKAAANYLGWHRAIAGEQMERFQISQRENLANERCGQPGCSQLAHVFYGLKARYCNEGHKTELPPSYAPTQVDVIGFCHQHKHRGDCGLEDSDSNYFPVTLAKETQS